MSIPETKQLPIFTKIEIEADNEEQVARLLEEAANNVRAGARTLNTASNKPGRCYTSHLWVVRR